LEVYSLPLIAAAYESVMLLVSIEKNVDPLLVGARPTMCKHRLFTVCQHLCNTTGSWPLAFGEEAIERSVTAANPFKSGVEANPAWSSQYFNVSFNNGTATAQLPGLFVTPDGSRPLPTVILTTGTDFTKEVKVTR